MPRKLPKYVTAERGRDGAIRIYFRRDKQSPRIRMPSPQDTQAFNEAYARCLSGAMPTPSHEQSGSLAWLIRRYKESAHWANLSPSTRRMRDNILKGVADNAGDAPYRSITRKHIQASMDKRTPNAANTFRKVMSGLFSWALSVELIETNPVDAVKSIKVKTDGFHTWTVEEVEQFRECHRIGTMARLALELMLFTGLRRGDVFRIGRQHAKNGTLSVRTSKTGIWVHVPIVPELQNVIDGTDSGDLTFLVTERGKPFTSEASFGNWFGKCCREAGVPGRAHGLRKAGATIAAENGATVHELMAMYGWTNPAQAMVYTRKAERRLMARGAAERIANKNPRTFTGSGNSADK